MRTGGSSRPRNSWPNPKNVAFEKINHEDRKTTKQYSFLLRGLPVFVVNFLMGSFIFLKANSYQYSLARSPARTCFSKGWNTGAPAAWAIHSATRMPSTAADVMPPAKPAPSPQG